MASLPASEFRVGIAMKCGCAAQGTISAHGAGALVGCLTHGCTELAETKPSIEGRTALCSYGGNEVPSAFDLPFFQHKPNEKHDRYYCGCWGWD